MRRSLVGLLAAALLSLGVAQSAAALPRESRVPGGVALIPLGDVVAGQPAPHAHLGDQPVLVSAEGRWRLLAIGDLETDPQTTMLTFTRWNKGSPVAAPAPEDVIG